MTSLTFYVFVTVITLKRLGHTPKKHNTGQWDPPQLHAFCNNLSRIQSFNIWPYSSKQTPENLSNGGFFFTGEYYSIKVCLSQEKHFFKALKLMYYSFLYCVRLAGHLKYFKVK